MIADNCSAARLVAEFGASADSAAMDAWDDEFQAVYDRSDPIGSAFPTKLRRWRDMSGVSGWLGCCGCGSSSVRRVRIACSLAEFRSVASMVWVAG